ncbi:MepB family protein [Lysinibacter sp. HNR]|uniref:MepB family protein n=1 Tax=Lysinibacter sp. HNR TaxID=3031408 RepID=UPI002434B151|nr:MepB family protein [Lysinibacter sp. HNR]WGD36793.1 MepB family protein [Lysinibacter sp. HNR]
MNNSAPPPPSLTNLTGGSVQFTAFYRYVELLGEEAPEYEAPQLEPQNSNYQSGVVRLNGELWRIRTARVTPTKPGAFVAVWKRNERGKTQPFDTDDPATGLLVFVEERDRFGVFRFQACQLEIMGITASVSQPGKRGFRLYPSWCRALNTQAAHTQHEQALAFNTLR